MPMWPLVLTLLAALGDTLGGYITVLQRITPGSIQRLLSLGAGFLLGAAFFDILPEALEALPSAPLYVGGGYFALFAIEHLFALHSHTHAHDSLTHDHHRHLHPETGHTVCDDAFLEQHARTAHTLVGEPHATSPQVTAAAGFAALAGLLIHTFLDGAAIGVGFLDGSRLGFLVFMAVFLHKLPEGISLSAIMLAAGQSRARALLATLAIAGSTVLGALTVFQLGSHTPQATGIFLSLAAGSFIYVGASDMIPAVSGRERSNLVLVLAGAAAILVLSRLLASVGLE